jgi:hypothetical protein
VAQTTYTPTLSTSDVNKIWRKVQGKIQLGLKFQSEEWQMLDDVEESDMDVSAREITVPIDINEGVGIASIPEGGWEAVPSSPNVEEVTLNWVLLNGRFTASKTARYLARRSAMSQMQDQIKYQGRKKIEALGDDFSDRFYGFSTGVLALVKTGGTYTANTSHTLLLKDAYGLSTITDAGFIARKFRVGDRVALVQGGALVTNAIGTITARSTSTPSITVTWNGSVTVTVGDSIVKANSMENETLAGTDYNKSVVGIFDMMTSSSLHSLTHDNWTVAYSDSTAGRFTGMDLHRARTEIGNFGTGDGSMRNVTILVAQGVERDMIDQVTSRLQYSSPWGMEIDGSVKSKGATIKSTRRVPPGYVFIFANGVIKKFTLIGKPDAPGWNDAKELQNQSGYVFTIDFPVQLICTNRKGLAYFSGATEI